MKQTNTRFAGSRGNRAIVRLKRAEVWAMPS
jgi:hypothetical protein